MFWFTNKKSDFFQVRLPSGGIANTTLTSASLQHAWNEWGDGEKRKRNFRAESFGRSGEFPLVREGGMAFQNSVYPLSERVFQPKKFRPGQTQWMPKRKINIERIKTT